MFTEKSIKHISVSIKELLNELSDRAQDTFKKNGELNISISVKASKIGAETEIDVKASFPTGKAKATFKDIIDEQQLPLFKD